VAFGYRRSGSFSSSLSTRSSHAEGTPVDTELGFLGEVCREVAQGVGGHPKALSWDDEDLRDRDELGELVRLQSLAR